MPAYFESRHIGDTVRRARQHAGHIVVVDDGPDDATAEAAAGAGAHVIRHPHNKGKGAALCTGLDHALAEDYAFVVTMDADGQHHPDDIPNFLAARDRTGAAVIVGNRMDAPRTMPWLRRLTNRYMSWLLSRRMGQRVPDTQNGFRLYARETLPVVMAAKAEGFAQESEVLLDLAAAGYRIESAPTRIIYGEEVSKINPVGDTIRFFGMLRRHRKTRGPRIDAGEHR
jgi:glycosyltransferase involved in cell wall biosynthesis